MLSIARISRLKREERGSALVAVIGVFAVVAVVGLAVAAVTINAVGYTSGTRAAVQAQATAEAGIDAASASLLRGVCPSAPLGTPDYTLSISYSVQATGEAWSPGCPAGPSKRIKIISKGSASAAGVAGNSSGDTRSVEAIFASPVSSSDIISTGAAIYAYSSTGFSGSGSLVPSVTGPTPNVQVKTGPVVCSGRSVIPSDLAVANGTLEIQASCRVNGNVWSTGKATLTGDVSVGGNMTSGGLALTGSSRVLGSAWSSGPTTMSGSTRIGGNLSGTALTMTGGTIKGNAWLSGAVSLDSGSKIEGLLTAKSLTGPGSTSGGKSIVPAGPGPGPAPAPTPVVPGWVDFNYDKTDWVGFSEKVVSGNCDFAVLQGAVDLLASGRGIIDARTCTNPISVSNWQKLALKNSLVIVAKNFQLGSGGGFSATSPQKLWLITEDTNKDLLPTCPAGAGFTLDGGFTLGSNITTMVYTPCAFKLMAGVSWRGQVFAGSATVDGGATMQYAPLGLPRVDLTTGVDSDNAGAASSSLIGERLSIRDVNG